MIQSAAIRTKRPTRAAWAVLPLVLFAIGAIMANAGVSAAPQASAATSNVTVEATVASSVTLTACTSPLGIAVNMGNVASGTCTVTYGASNNAALPLTMHDNAGAGQFMTPANFSETTATCAALSTTADTIGYKVASGGTSTKSTTCTASAAGTNADYSPFPNSAATVCTTNAAAQQTCPLAVMITEAGSNATAGTYSGTMVLAA